MNLETRLLALLARGPLAARDLCALLGVSQATFSRIIGRAGDSVIRIGGGRSTRYGAAATHTPATALYAAASNGQVTQIGVLRPLQSGEYYLQQAEALTWLIGAGGDGLFDGLPYYLSDLRPQGFLGRKIAAHLALSGRYPSDPRAWNDQHTLQYLLDEGHDLPGNLLLGERSLHAYQRTRPHIVTDRQREYPQRVDNILAGGIPDSSAGGEQQKFTAYTADSGHVIVKFSPAGDSPEAQRWRDLLVAESIALNTLRNAGIAVATHTVHDIAGRIYLESARFDRTGPSGRLPMLSLAAIDAEFVGRGQNWIDVAERLHRSHRLPATDYRNIVFSHTFGQWINNTDMHLGNISLAPNDSGFELLPIYDMLPMGFAIRQGEEVVRPFIAPVRMLANQLAWQECGELALRYWQGVAEDIRISERFRDIAVGQCGSIGRALANSKSE